MVSPLILIIEDEPDLVATLEYRLKKEGFQTRSALTGSDGIKYAQLEPTPDLILLDLMLPDIPGTDVCKELRSQNLTGSIPILMLTAKGDESDRIVGLEVGADDYMSKPYNMKELLLRMRAILRRVTKTVMNQDKPTSFGPIKMDRDAHRVWLEDREITLTVLEFKLLSTFIERKGRAQTRETLLDVVWGYQPGITTRTVDTHVKRLREKMGPAGTFIQTIRGVGYRFDATMSKD
jgi:two-component system, OmpR family, phosphate regulon response regulator PhoB